MFPLFDFLFLIPTALAIVAGWLWMRQRDQAAYQSQRLAELESQAQQWQQDLAQQREQLAVQAEQIAEQRGREGLMQKLEQDLAEREAQLDRARQQISSLEQRQAELQARREELERSFDAQKSALKDEFQNLSQSILKTRTDEFKKDSQESLGHLLSPLREQISAFQKRVNEVHQDSSNANSALKNELENLKNLNQRITDEATNLTLALKGDSKTQGNWGEMQVEMILDRSGLIKGQEYHREQHLTDEEGVSYRPDFVVNLPEGRHLIIDSKVSLLAWTEFVEAQSDEQREAAMKRHVASISKHIDQLSAKNYPKLKGLNAPDFVLMFMPIEPAFLAAFQANPELYATAFEKGVIVVVPSTLLGTLRTVANLWSLQKQGESAADIAEQASKLQDKLRIFMEKFDKIGAQMDTLRKSYDDATRTLGGRGGLSSVVGTFEKKGVRFKQSLPELGVDETAPDSDE